MKKGTGKSGRRRVKLQYYTRFMFKKFLIVCFFAEAKSCKKAVMQKIEVLMKIHDLMKIHEAFRNYEK